MENVTIEPAEEVLSVQLGSGDDEEEEPSEEEEQEDEPGDEDPEGDDERGAFDHF